MFLDLRAEPMILVIPPMGDRQYWFPVSDLRHDFDANLSWDTVGGAAAPSPVRARLAGRAARGCAAVSTWARRSSGCCPASR
jgi:hypothetical protein